jgi:hypothetical protein
VNCCVSNNKPSLPDDRMRNHAKTIKPKLSLRRVYEIAKFYHFAGPADLDELSISTALNTLQAAANNHPECLTLETALKILSAEYAKQKSRDAGKARPVKTPDDPPLPTSPHVTASWRDTRVWS